MNLKNNGKNKDDINIMDTRVKPEYDKQGNEFLRNSSRITVEENLSSFVFFMCGAKKHSHLLSSNKKGEYASSLLPSDILHLFTNKLKTLWRLTFKLSNE